MNKRWRRLVGLASSDVLRLESYQYNVRRDLSCMTGKWDQLLRWRGSGETDIMPGTHDVGSLIGIRFASAVGKVDTDTEFLRRWRGADQVDLHREGG